MRSTDNLIEERVGEAIEGSVFFISDFSDLGSKGAIRIALHRLVKRNTLQRISRGIYGKPYVSELLNKEVQPSLDKVAKEIARRDKARILPTGSYALHVLGLSTQIPLNVVYYTDGKARKIKIGERTILFKKTSTKKLSYKGELSKLVILAMSEIGNGKLTIQEEEKLLKILENENILDLKHDMRLAPQWIAEFLAKALQ